MTLTIGPLTDFSLRFPVVCFVFVFDQTLVEHLYRGKSLLLALGMLSFQVGWNTFTNRATPWEKASFFSVISQVIEFVEKLTQLHKEDIASTSGDFSEWLQVNSRGTLEFQRKSYQQISHSHGSDQITCLEGGGFE